MRRTQKGVLLKQGTFIRRKYYKLFAGSLLGAVANGVNTMLDSVLSGNQLGETALTAVSIIAPLSFVLYFFASMYTPGYGFLYGKYNGEFDKENAYRIAGQSVVMSMIIGGLLAGGLAVLKQPFLRYYSCTGALYENASVYYNWKIVSALLLPLANALYYLVSTDADTLMVSIGGIASIAANIVLSSVLCRFFGVAGLGMGTSICVGVAIVFYSLHWLRKTNSIHFKLCFSLKEFCTAVRLSSALALSYLFVALTDIVMNKVILVSCGVTMITAYSVINLVYGFYDGFGAPFNAAAGLTSTFQGEKNNAGIKNVMKTTANATVGLGLVFSALLLVFAPLLPDLYGIESPEIVEASVRAARWMALASVPYGISYVMLCIYPTFGKIGFGVVMTFLNDLFCPLALSIPLAFLFGFRGVTIGMAVNAYLVLILFSLFLVGRYGKKNFPLYLVDYGEETVSFDLKIMPESIVVIRDKVAAALVLHGYEIENIELLIEELYKRIYEKNSGITVMSECVLLFGSDYVRVIVRDDGVIFNFVDENNKVESVNAHTLNSLLERVQDKEYILTTSFNRNGFIFEK